VSYCPCNVFRTTPTGGALVGGTTTAVNTSITGGALVGGQTRASVSDDVFCNVEMWLLQESGNGTAGEFKDRSRHALDGTGGSGTACPTRTTGVYCRYAQEFSGRQWIALPQDDYLSTQPLTVSLWVQINTKGLQRTFFSRGYNTPSGDVWTLQLGHTVLNTLYGQLLCRDGSNNAVVVNVQGQTRLGVGAWYHIALVWTPGESVSVYVDGNQDGSTSTTLTSLAPLTTGGFVGRLNSAAWCTACIQDVRVDGTALDSAYLKAIYANICTPSTFYSVGSEIPL
jgi:hypothetical protein